MSKRRILAFVLCAGLTLSGCGAQIRTAGQKAEQNVADTETQRSMEKSTGIPEVSGQSTKEVLMVYMVGSNLESESGLASADIREMQKSGFNEDNLTVLICTGGSSKWWNSKIPDDSCSIFELTADGLTQCADLGERSMADQDTLTDFVDYAYQTWPAEQYGILESWRRSGAWLWRG